MDAEGIQALSLAQPINEMDNPFLHDTPELLKLDTCDVLDGLTVHIVEKLGIKLYHECVIKD